MVRRVPPDHGLLHAEAEQSLPIGRIDRDRVASGRQAAVHAPPAAESEPVWHQNQLTNPPTNHCFLAISDYIAAQRVRFARSLWPGFLLGALRHPEIQVFERDPEKWVPVFR